MIKPNLGEFEELVGKKLSTLAQIIFEAKKFLKFCPMICISSVKKGVLLVTQNANYLAEGPHVIAKSSVGAGDSLVGGMTAGMLSEGFHYEMFFDNRGRTAPNNIKNSSWHTILSLGMGAALATISEHGTTLGNRNSILRYAKKIRISEV
jgi:fructose-1-phosphate kinase PfkB-like protein